MRKSATLLPFFLILLSFISACRKDSTESTYLTFQFDNVNYSFDSISVRVDTFVNNTETFIYALNTTTTSYVMIGLNSSFNVTGRYTNDAWPNTDRLPTGFGIERFWLYVADRNGIYGGGGYDLFEMKSTPFTFTVEHTSEKTMRINGTFSGTIAEHSSLFSGMLSDGKFNLPFLYH